MLTLELATSGGCTSRQAKLTLDANWRWVHETTGYQNCYTGDSWDGGKCSDPATCAANCGMSIPPFDFILLPRHLASSHVHHPFLKPSRECQRTSMKTHTESSSCKTVCA